MFRSLHSGSGSHISSLPFSHTHPRRCVRVKDSCIAIVYSSSFFGPVETLAELDYCKSASSPGLTPPSLTTALFSFPCSPSVGFSCIFYTCSFFFFLVCIKRNQRERWSERERTEKREARVERVGLAPRLTLLTCTGHRP